MVSFAGLGPVVSRTDVLPPRGSVHQETNVDLGAPPASGWALATCSGPVKASLLFRRRNSEGMPVAEAGVHAATVPATRFVTFAEQGEGKNGTGVAYANPSDTAALVTFTARDADGEVLAIEDLMLPPNWHGAQNMPTPVRSQQLYRIDRNHLHAAHRQSVAPPYFPPCLRGNWMLPRRDRLHITSLILPWERVGKPRSPISTTPRRR